MFHRALSLGKSIEQLQIEKALITPYEKTIKILKKVVNYLGDKNPLAEEVRWVIDIIIGQKLYYYEGLNKLQDYEESKDLKLVLGILNEYSEGDVFSRNIYKKPQTVQFKSDNLSGYRDMLKNYKSEILSESSSNEEEDKDVSEEKDKINFNSDKESDNDDKKKSEKKNINTKKSSRLATHRIRRAFSKNVQSNFYLLDNIDSLLVNKLSNDLFSFEFNVFDFYDKYENLSPFTLASQIILNKYDLSKYSNSSIIYNFVKEIKENYTKKAIYHTEKHGLDMLQTLAIYISKTNLINNLDLNNIDILSLLVAGLCHDVGHEGYNNDYQIKMSTDLSITYNDKSILENFHISLTFKILKKDNCNIFNFLSKNEYSYVRKRMIELVLSTDMSFHSRIIALMKNRVENNNIKEGKNCEKIINKEKNDNIFNEQQEVLNYLIHIGDLSHSSKKFDITYKWSYLLSEEFWRQGDEEKEKGFSINFLFERSNTDVPRNQVGFMKGIIIPSFEILVDFLPELNYYWDNVNKNLNQWIELADKNQLEREKKQYLK
jgi:hypothetical protein